MKFDWDQLRWDRTEELAQGQAWRMNIASDWAPVRAYADLIRSEPAAVYGDMLSLLRQGDWNLVNVEAALGGTAPIPKAGPNFIGDARSGVACLQAAEFHTACLANNHAMDFGAEGLRATMDALRAGGLDYVGAGVTPEEVERPVWRSFGGARVAVLNFAEGGEAVARRGEPGVNGFDLANMLLKIRHLKQCEGADAVVVIFHGGREYAPVPPPYVVKALRQLARGGAAAVIAHHPHVPQGIEIYEGVPIVYSQGNFAFWQERDKWSSHVGYLVHLDFTGRCLYSLGITPYLIERTGLRLMPKNELPLFSERMRRASAVLESDEKINALWAAFADQAGIVEYLMGELGRLSTDVAEGRADAVSAMRCFDRFRTAAHANLIGEILDRYVRQERGGAPKWAVKLLEEWFDEEF